VRHGVFYSSEKNKTIAHELISSKAIHNMKNPNMEELANTGIILSQSYVQPICTPTRSALLTGRYPHALGRQ
ncbi:hypothetical protein SK128_000741, partial [Halocaridina rubra]